MTLPDTGSYRIIDTLGGGGMAEVYLAERQDARGLTKRLVIKRIRPSLRDDPEFHRLFEREAAIGLSLNHPNLVQVFGFEQVSGNDALIMEYVEGTDLSKIPNTTLSPHMIASIGAQALEGLRYLHERNEEAILHRDISPGNVLIDQSGTVKLTDFGISKPVKAIDESKTSPIGTWRYLSPERRAGKDPTASDDIFALGVVLKEVLSEIESTTESESLNALLDSWTSTDLGERPNIADSALTILREWIGDGEGRFRDELGKVVCEHFKAWENEAEDKTQRLLIKPVMKKTWPRSAIILAVFLVAILAAITIWQLRPTPPPEESKAKNTTNYSPVISSLWRIDARPKHEVIIDGVQEGKTPLSLQVFPGRHEVELIPLKEGSEKVKRMVHLIPGANPEWYFRK